MSFAPNDQYLESRQELYEDCVIRGDYVAAQEVVKSLRDDGFDFYADLMAADLLQTPLSFFTKKV